MGLQSRLSGLKVELALQVPLLDSARNLVKSFTVEDFDKASAAMQIIRKAFPESHVIVKATAFEQD
jgi:hypothetical protein